MYIVEVLPIEAGLCATWEITNVKIKHQMRHLFLDRDGVIIKDNGYVNSLENTEFIYPMIRMMELATSLDIPITVITNQAGVAHGFFTEEELIHYNLQLLELLDDKFMISVNALLYCPSHPTAEVSRYKIQCGCRKPMTGLFERANAISQADNARSIFVGDKHSDKTAAFRLNMKYFNYDAHNDIKFLEDWILDVAAK
jgi:D-glycero-D-manno-heptose 1,7-bisphosphate phosphatase